ncbi:MAG: heme exporter protein CcmD [Pseudomonadota bacterium]
MGLTELFGERYFGFIASSYAVTAIVLIALIVWVVLTHRSRRATLGRLEAAGIRRASQDSTKAGQSPTDPTSPGRPTPGKANV